LKILFVIAILLVTGVAGWLQFFPEQATRVALHAGRKLAGLERKQAVLADGLQLTYLEGGQGEPLLLLHGFGANKDIFTDVARFLTPHYRVIVPDLAGFGESAHPPEADYAPPAQVERVRVLAQALGITRLHLGGSSMGGQIALTYAALHGVEVASLWLLCPAGVWSAPESEIKKIIRETGRNPLLVKSEEDYSQLLAFTMSQPPFIPSAIQRVMARERIQNFALEERIFQQILGYGVEERVVGLTIPALIVCGEEDRTLHRATPDILHRLLPRSEVIVMPGIGHLPMLEASRQSARDYLRFRESLMSR